MKKTYIKPNALTVRIENNLMLITSDTNADKGGEVLSRRGRFSRWEEEDLESEE